MGHWEDASKKLGAEAVVSTIAPNGMCAYHSYAPMMTPDGRWVALDGSKTLYMGLLALPRPGGEMQIRPQHEKAVRQQLGKRPQRLEDPCGGFDPTASGSPPVEPASG